MTCASCIAFDAAERAAMIADELPAHVLDGCVCDDAERDVLFVSPERFHRSPQVGTPCRMTWAQLVAWLSRPSVGDAKDIAGAWSPALYRDNVRRKANLVHAWGLVVDVDEAGDVDAVADVVSRYRGAVHETFRSTDDAPRCRIVLVLTDPIDVPNYDATHGIVRAHLARVGIVADEGAKDASRLSYAPVRRPGSRYRFRVLDGAPLDARAVLAAQPSPKPRPATRPPAPEHRDAYKRAAMRRAADAIASANAGVRHYTLSREAFALARLGLTDDDVTRALLPSFVAAAGRHREHEGVRTIRDAVRARQGAA